MKDHGLPYKSADGYNGTIHFDIIEKKPGTQAGSTCYVIRVREKFGLCNTPIYEFNGFYNRNRDKFTLYPKKRLNPSFLEYPFTRQDVNAFWVHDRTIHCWESVDENTDLEEFLKDMI